MTEGSVPCDILFLCKVLSPWTGEEEALRLKETARKGRVRWEEIAFLANRSNLAPALRVSLRARKLWPYTPVELRGYLDEVYRFNEHRNRLLLEELIEVSGLLNRAEIPPLLLKGAAALATGLFADPAVRFMWDLDVLVPAGKIRDAVHALTEGGYFVPDGHLPREGSLEVFYLAKHFAPLVKEGGKAVVELHRRVVEDKWRALLNTEAVWRESSFWGSSLLPGVALAVMSPTHQIVHSFIHSQLAHENHRDSRLDLRQMHHFAHLCLRHRKTVDWERVAALREEGRAGRALGVYLHLARELFGVEMPLCSIPNGYSRRYALRALFLTQRRLKWPRILKAVLGRLMGCLSEQRLKACYPSKARWRRLRRMADLLARYSRLEPWKALIGTMSRRYDSLG